MQMFSLRRVPVCCRRELDARKTSAEQYSHVIATSVQPRSSFQDTLSSTVMWTAAVWTIQSNSMIRFINNDNTCRWCSVQRRGVDRLLAWRRWAVATPQANVNVPIQLWKWETVARPIKHSMRLHAICFRGTFQLLQAYKAANFVSPVYEIFRYKWVGSSELGKMG